MEGELAALEPPAFRAAETVQLEHQLTHFCLENMAFIPTSQAKLQLRVTPVSQTYPSPEIKLPSIHTVVRQPIITEIPIGKATE